MDCMKKWYLLCVGKRYELNSPCSNQVEGCKPLLQTLLAMPQVIIKF